MAILSTSEEINNQINDITNNQSKPIINFLSTYRRSEFEHIGVPSKDKSPFNVLFVGRVETNKGIFDLLEIAKRFKAEEKDDIIFHICGNGSALTSLKTQVESSHITASFLLHGHCDKIKMKKMLSMSHILIVPTTIDFEEGLNQVVVEGVLANRPVITSSVCPAILYVREAIVEVPPGDIKAYANAIIKLKTDSDLYEHKKNSCVCLQEQFYGSSSNWGEAVKSILTQTWLSTND